MLEKLKVRIKTDGKWAASHVKEARSQLHSTF